MEKKKLKVSTRADVGLVTGHPQPVFSLDQRADWKLRSQQEVLCLELREFASYSLSFETFLFESSRPSLQLYARPLLIISSSSPFFKYLFALLP